VTRGVGHPGGVAAHLLLAHLHRLPHMGTLAERGDVRLPGRRGP
jgi:hypothetical protein